MRQTPTRALHPALLAAAGLALALVAAAPARAQLSGASVAVGAASIATPSSGSTVITQSSDKALINWQSFSLAADAKVVFQQPGSSSIVLNRVLGSQASAIDGSLSANGQVWLINPNGVLFGPSARIDVAGLLATTSDIDDGDFTDGKYDFRSTSSRANAAILNAGSIRAAEGGSVVLAAASVANQGLIEADLGSVVLAGANAFSVDFDGDNLLRFAIAGAVSQQPAGGALVSNSGTVAAAGGKVLLTARAAREVVGNVINTSGIVEAKSASVQNGTIVLDAGPDGTALVSGTLDASGKAKGETGGAISVLGGHTIVADGARLDASGDAGGGAVLVGGNIHGSGSEPHAQTTNVGDAVLSADAIREGDGGTVVLWSDGVTRFAGRISANGGAEGGNGGAVETSGGALGVSAAARVSASAAKGVAGTWLLDPKNITVVTGGTGTVGSASYATSPSSDMTIDPVTITSALHNINVTLEANTDIVVTNAISTDATATKTLALNAGRSILVNADINIPGASLALIANDPNAVGANRDAGAGQITTAAGVKLTANTIDMRLLNGSTAGAIGSSSAPVLIDTNTIHVQTSGANAFLRSPDRGVTIGTAAGGIDVGAGSLVFYANGDLTLASGGTVSALGSGDALVLATTGAFTNSAGSSALTVGGSGRWLVFASDPSVVTKGGLSAAPFYNRSFNFTTGSYTAIASTSNRFVYTTAPTLTVTAQDKTRSYGTANPTFTTAITGLLTGDTLSGAVSGAASLTTSATSSSPIGSYSIVAGLGTLASDYNYAFQFANGTLTVTQATLTASLTGTVSKVYDGTTAASLASGNYALSGVVSGDSVALNNPSSGTYDNKNVGTGKTVSVTGLSISGADSGNYTLASTSISGAVGTISAKSLTASLVGSTSKVYDATTAAALGSGNYALTGVLTGETVTLNNPASGTYSNKNVGSGKTVTATGLAISGADSGNYALSSTSASGAIGTITQASLSASLTGTVSKVYDGTTAATLASGNYILSGVFAGDSVTLNNPAGSYATKTVGTGKTVSVSGLALSGTDAGNYALSSTAISGAIGTITAKTLTASLTGTVSRLYNATTAATLAPGNYVLSGVVSGDTVSLNNPASGTYDTKNVGTGKTVTVTGLAISGGDAGNYSLSSTSVSGAIGIIQQASLTASLTGTVGKVYDGTTAATLASGNYVLTGVFAGDSVALNNPTSGSYDTKSVGTGKTVSVAGLAISGTDAGNYGLSATSVSGAVGTITAKSLSASLTGSVSKIYDGTTAATLASGNYVLTGVVSGDSVALNNPTSGSYDTKNVGTGKTVSVAGLAISSSDAANYALSSTSVSGAVGIIAEAALTAGLTGTVTKTYDGTTAATLAPGNFTLAGVVSGDTVALNNPASGSYDNKNAGTGKTVTVAGLTLLGTDAANYALSSTSVSGAVGVINRAALSAVLAGTAIKVYDGTVTAALASGNYVLTGVVSGDTVALNNPVSGSYDTKNVGTGKTVSVAGLAISGADAGNYTLSSTAISGAIGTITAKSLSASLTGTVGKVYDGTTAASLAADNYALAGVVTGDAVSLNNPASGSYDTKNVGTGKTVSVAGLAVSGADAGNYTLSSTSISGAVGTITAKSLSASLTGTVGKVYDGTTAATLASGNYALSGVVTGDSVALNNPTSGTYDTKNVGTGKTVSVAGLAISGGDAANYALASTSISGAVGTITAKSLTASLTGTVSKVYDGTTAATLASGNYALSGVVAGDTVALNNPTSGTYDNKNVGTGKTVSAAGLAISGGDAANYALSSASISGAVGTITQATLTAALTGTVSKVYDGTTAATLASGNYTLSGVVTGDSVALNNPTSGTYDNKNVGTGKTVSVGGLAISGGDAANYALASTSISGAVGTITAKSLTASLTGTVSKIYDGTTVATLASGNYALSGVVTGDVVALNNPTSGAYDTKNVGTGKTVSVAGLAISGGDAGNYALASATISGAVGTITQATLTASLTGTVSKVYDGTTAATLASGNYALSGVVTGDVVALNNPTSGAYDTKTVGTGKTVSVGGLAISGADAGNYALLSASITGAVGTITQKTLTPLLAGTVSRTYNGTTAAPLTAGNYALSGVVAGDSVALGGPSAGTYDNKNVGTGKTVTAAGLTLSGAGAGNYALSSTSISGAVGTVTAKSLTASLTGTVEKVYDGTTAASLAAGNYALAGVVTGDAVALNNPTSGTYDTKNVGTGKTVSVAGLAVSGAEAGNYTLSSTAISGAVGTITAKSLSASLTGTVGKIYDGTTAASLAAGNYALAGVVTGDGVALNNPASGTYDSKNVGTSKMVSVAGLAISGTDAGNYALSSTSISGAVGSIAAKAVTASLTGTVSRVYDSTVAAALTAANYLLSGVVSGDVVALNNPVSGSYDTKNVGTGKTVSVSGLAISGADAGNYALASTAISGAIGTITQAALTASLTGTASKIYDGTTAATLAAGNYTLSGVVLGDVVALNNPVSGTYDSKNIGTGKTVSVTGLAISGGDAANYALASTAISGAIGTITQKTLTPVLAGTSSRTYNGTTAAPLTASNYTLSGVIAGDSVALGGPAAGTYDNKNVGSGKTVSVAGLTLSGAGAGNYALSSTSVSAAIGTITAATVTASLTGTVSKAYDRSTAASLTPGNYALSGVFGSDSIAVNGPAVGSYDNKNAGSGKTVSVSGVSLSGADLANYVLASDSASGGVGVITRLSAGASLIGSVSKVYDGTAQAVLSAGNYTLSGILSGDSVALNNSSNGTYDSSAVGSGKLVTVTGLGLTGADAGNYLLASSSLSGAVGAIARATLTAGLTGTIVKMFDGTTAATLAAGNYTLAGAASGDSIGLNNPSTGTYDSATAGSGKVVTVSGLALTGSSAGNYLLAANTVSAAIGEILTPTVASTLLTVFLPPVNTLTQTPPTLDLGTQPPPVLLTVANNGPAPAGPLETLGGNGNGGNGDTTTATDNVTQSVGQSLDGSRRPGTAVNAANTLGGLLNTLIPTLPTFTPHGVPPADQDFSSWGNEALWQ